MREQWSFSPFWTINHRSPVGPTEGYFYRVSAHCFYCSSVSDFKAIRLTVQEMWLFLYWICCAVITLIPSSRLGSHYLESICTSFPATVPSFMVVAHSSSWFDPWYEKADNNKYIWYKLNMVLRFWDLNSTQCSLWSTKQTEPSLWKWAQLSLKTETLRLQWLHSPSSGTLFCSSS